MNRSTVTGAVLLALALLLDVIATNRLAIALGPASDLFPRWVGARAWVIEHLDPYGAGVTSTVRSAMGEALGWDGTADSGAFAFGFVYPGYVALLLAPLAVLPFPVASTIWLLIAQASVVGTVWLVWHTSPPHPVAPVENTLRLAHPIAPVENTLRLAHPIAPDENTLRLAHPSMRPLINMRFASPVRLHDANRGLAITTVLAILWPPVIYNLIFGQFAALATLAIATAGWATVRHHDRFAGTILPISLVKPQLALIPVTLWVAGQVTLWFRPKTPIDLPSPGRPHVGGEAHEGPPVLGSAAVTPLMRAGMPADRDAGRTDTSNWHGIGAFAVTVAAVGAASLVALPHWPGAFLNDLNGYAVTARATTTIGIIASVITSQPIANAFIQAILIGVVLATVFLAPGPSARTRYSLLPAGILISAWMVPPVYEWNHVVGLLILVPLIRNRLDAPVRSDMTGEVGTDGRPVPVTNHLFPSLRYHPPRRPLHVSVRSSQSPPGSYAPLRAQWEGVLHAAATWRWTPAVTWGITNIATLPLAVLWPDGSRAVWPVILLGAWVIDHRTRPHAPTPPPPYLHVRSSQSPPHPSLHVRSSQSPSPLDS